AGGTDRSAAGGAVLGHHEGPLGAIAQRLDRGQDLGDHVPALRRTMVSPMSTPLRSTSNWLCRVASSTVEPATFTGSITPKGVTRPVRPTLTWMSSSRVVTSSGGYLYAMAQRGAREVDPRARCWAKEST